jgi:hypothetical protein
MSRSPEQPEDDLEIFFQILYDEDDEMFHLQWLDKKPGSEGEIKKYFGIKMIPETFEEMANHLLKEVKNYNLMQAKKFLEKKNGK